MSSQYILEMFIVQASGRWGGGGANVRWLAIAASYTAGARSGCDVIRASHGVARRQMAQSDSLAKRDRENYLLAVVVAIRRASA